MSVLLERVPPLAEEPYFETEPWPRRWSEVEFDHMLAVGLLSPAERPWLDGGQVLVPGSPDPLPRRWSVEEYHRLAELGLLLRGRRVELIEGEILEMSPQKSPHASAVHIAAEVVGQAFGQRFVVRQQAPIGGMPSSEPEPDVAVVIGSHRDYVSAHPTTALLVLEVSDTTLTFDRGRKASLYAKLGFQDYWLVNLRRRRLEIRREPVSDASQPYGYRYAALQVLEPGQEASPLAAPEQAIAVSDLLP